MIVNNGTEKEIGEYVEKFQSAKLSADFYILDNMTSETGQKILDSVGN